MFISDLVERRAKYMSHLRPGYKPQEPKELRLYNERDVEVLRNGEYSQESSRD